MMANKRYSGIKFPPLTKNEIGEKYKEAKCWFVIKRLDENGRYDILDRSSPSFETERRAIEVGEEIVETWTGFNQSTTILINKIRHNL